ncbi:nucleotide sugar dehydrogenase, partial [Magnetococcales bacterium HHB-1]
MMAGFQKDADAIDVTVIGGAGHVGLPLALVFADTGLNVRIQDLNDAVMEEVQQGKLPYIEYDAQPYLDRALKNNRLSFSSDPKEVPSQGVVIITIGTPVDEFLNPVHKAVKQCIDDLLPQLKDDQLIILRSTLFPGSTDWADRYLRSLGRKIKVAFCPERVVQGYAIKELKGMPQIVSGTSQEAEDEAAALFERICPEVIRVQPKEAEFAKLFSNAYRYINFAITNQFYMITDSADVDYDRIMHAMTSGYERMKGFPKPGFAAGPCLFKDTMQLAAFSRNNFSLGHDAMLVNEGLVLHIIDRLRQQFVNLEQLTIGLLGMAFKPEVD